MEAQKLIGGALSAWCIEPWRAGPGFVAADPGAPFRSAARGWFVTMLLVAVEFAGTVLLIFVPEARHEPIGVSRVWMVPARRKHRLFIMFQARDGAGDDRQRYRKVRAMFEIKNLHAEIEPMAARSRAGSI